MKKAVSRKSSKTARTHINMSSHALGIKPGDTENLAELENLNEETLLEELRIRFNRDDIYTYVGEILVTVNPFKWIDGIYSPAQMKKYSRIGDKKLLTPHLFATADIAFQNMVSQGRDQVCVISGESGAGKTEAAKLFVKQLVSVSHGVEFEGLERKLIQVNPVLEAFGNAKTGMNNNSSRFGKFIEVRFTKEGCIKGALQRQYLLEKSRVVSQGDDEQNFHVFYLFFAGITAAQKSQFEVDDPSKHRFLYSNPEALSQIQGHAMVEMRKELDECIQIVGFSHEQKEELFHILAGILHLGDLEFQGEESSRVVNTATLTKVCNQLGLDEHALELALTRQVNIIRGEETEREYKVDQAEDCRDATAKALYEYTFDWIVRQCNLLLGPKNGKQAQDDTYMGILDIFGFECFDTNSFEQLCINLANEQLQFFFNDHIFAMELAEYAKEGIPRNDITYQDNKALLDLILESKPLGLFGILDEEASFPKATDSSMIMKFHASFSKHKDYSRPKSNANIFTLKHYAGAVTYDGENFLEKNRDTLAVDVIGCMRLSENTLIRTVFGEHAVDNKRVSAAKKKGRQKMERGAAKAGLRASMTKARATLAKKKKLTVANVFKQSLAELMVKLNAAAPHFIRCIKPNTRKAPNNFDPELVTKQLRYTGMLETTRIRREGYASRPLFADFVRRYQAIGYEMCAKVTPTHAACLRILKKSGIEGFAVGKTKVFLRYWHVDQLNECMVPFQMAAITLQRFGRGFVARAQYKKLLAAKRLQEKNLSNFFAILERNGQTSFDVVSGMCQEDAKRPVELLLRGPPAPSRAPSTKKEVSRAQSVKWFKETEKEKGAGLSDTGGFADWFHGIISRKESENLLKRHKRRGTFLIRVAESRFGYSLSLFDAKRCKHFMITQEDDGAYIVVGNDRRFPSLNEIVMFHRTHPVTEEEDYLLYPCTTEGDRADLRELE